MSETPPTTTMTTSKGLQQNNDNITFAVQCGECFKWRLIEEEHEYEEIRSRATEAPFVCSRKPNTTCEDAADIECDSSKTWVIDKENIPKTPIGFKRQLVLRRDYSKLDAYYVTPGGKKLRSGVEIVRFLESNPDIQGVDARDFSFAVPKVVAETIPKDAARKVQLKAKKRAKIQ